MLAVSLELLRNLLVRGMVYDELLKFFCASGWKQGNYLAGSSWKCGRCCMGRIRKVAFVVIKISLYFIESSPQGKRIFSARGHFLWVAG